VAPCLRGRGAELATLTSHIQKAFAGRGHAVLVRGPAGIGKTALLKAVRDWLPFGAATVLDAACGNAAIDYDAVRRLFASLDLTSNTSLLQGRALRARHAFSLERPSSSGVDHYSVWDGLCGLANRIMAESPLVLILDNVDSCDSTSLRWIDFLLRRSDRKPLLVLLAGRTGSLGENTSLLSGILDHGLCSTIELGPLPDTAVTDVIAHNTGQWPTSAFTTACADVSGSNPLFLTRLLDEVRQAGLSPNDEHAEQVVAVGRNVTAMAVLAELAEQSEPVHRVAAVIALLGDAKVEVELIAAMARVPIATAASAIETLFSGKVSVQDDAIRSAILGEQPPEVLAQLRMSVAQLLNDAGYPAETVAVQLVGLATLPGRWMLSTLLEGAQAAANSGRIADAATFLHRLLIAEPHNIEARLELAEALTETDPHAAREVLKEGLAFVSDPDTAAMIAVRFAMTSLAVGDTPESVRVLGEALLTQAAGFNGALDTDDHDLLMRLKATMIFVGLRDQATVSAAQTMARTVRAPNGDTAMERMLLAALAVETAAAGRSVLTAVEQARKALKIHAERGPEYGSVPAAMVLELADDPATTLAVLDQTAAFCRHSGAMWTQCNILALRASTLVGVGELANAEAAARDAIAVIEETPWRNQAFTPWIALALVLASRGDPTQAAAVLNQIDVPHADRSIWDYHTFLMVRAAVYEGLGEREAALADLLACGQSAEQVGLTNPVLWPWWHRAALLLAKLGRQEEAIELVECGEALSASWATDRAVGQCKLARGVVMGGDEGLSLLTDAVELFAGSPFRLLHAQAEYQLGAALLQAGDLPGARTHLRLTVDLSVRCDYLALGYQARDLLIEAGGRMRPLSGFRLDALTTSELQIAELVASGHTNQQIAESLFVTIRAVEVHLTNIYRKLGVPNRSGLSTVMNARWPP
jgi:DNA-binding CsgD family transcriptional regulator